MTRGKQTTALALAGAIALASGAYALGSQAGDGSAEAARTAAPHAAGPGGMPFGHGHHGFWGGPGRPGFDDLASRLGVSEDKLRTALEELAQEHRGDVATALADALGVDRAKVQAAFDKLRAQRPMRPDEPRRPGAFVAALAKQLGIPEAKVRAALEANRDHHTGPAGLAQQLGVSEQKLRDAFHAVFDKLRPHGPGRPGLTGLAKALGVTQAQLDAAFEKLRAGVDKRRDEFAAELAAKLGISTQKVQDAIGDLPRLRFGRHHP